MGFRDAFNRKKKERPVPPAWEKYIESHAPEGTYYEKIGDNDYQLVSDKGGFEMKCNFELPDDLKHISLSSADDVQELLYRTQRSIDVKNVTYILNGKEVGEEVIFKSFGATEETQQSKHSIIPMKFPKPVNLPIKINDHEYNFQMERQPYASLTKVILSSINNTLIKLIITIDEESQKFTITLNYNFDYVDSVEKILENKKLLIDYHSRKVEVFGQEFNEKKIDNTTDIEKTINFYEKLKKVADKFSITFNVKQNLKYSDVENLEKIYTSFILDEYYYTNETISKFNISLKKEEKNVIPSQPKKKFGVSGFNELTLPLLDQEISFTEQFFIPAVEFSHKEEVEDEKTQVWLNVLEEKRQYKKLFTSPQGKPNFNILSKKIGTAVKISV